MLPAWLRFFDTAEDGDGQVSLEVGNLDIRVPDFRLCYHAFSLVVACLVCSCGTLAWHCDSPGPFLCFLALCFLLCFNLLSLLCCFFMVLLNAPRQLQAFSQEPGYVNGSFACLEFLPSALRIWLSLEVSA